MVLGGELSWGARNWASQHLVMGQVSPEEAVDINGRDP